MKKPLVVALIVAVIVIGGGVGIWMAVSHSNGGGQSSNDTTTNATDMTSKSQVAVDMRDLSFTPANIKIKKGTTVTWTNQDTVAHNVVAVDASNAGGLPTDAPTFGHGGTFSFTFNKVGTFNYECIPHKGFMHGSVQVVD